MRERAARIGAALTVVSSASSGTEVKMIVPGRVIFRGQAAGPFATLKAHFTG